MKTALGVEEPFPAESETNEKKEYLLFPFAGMFFEAMRCVYVKFKLLFSTCKQKKKLSELVNICVAID